MTVAATADAGAGHAGSVSRHFACFDGLRAIAATLIVAHHAGFASGDTFRYEWGVFLGRMDIGVPIFFALSGFLLFRPYVAAQFAGVEPIPRADFWTRRVLRIFPGYWAALFLQVIIGGIVVHSIFGLLVYMSLTQIYFQRFVIGAITQSWSLATEISFYAFLPFWATWMRRICGGSTINRQAMRLLAALGGLVVLSFVWRGFIIWLDPSWKALTPYWLPSLIELFAVGMALAVVSAWGEHRSVIRTAGEAIGRHPGGLLDRRPRPVLVRVHPARSPARSLQEQRRPRDAAPDRLRARGPRADAACRVRRSAQGPDPRLPVTPGDGVPGFDLVRDLPLAPVLDPPLLGLDGLAALPGALPAALPRDDGAQLRDRGRSA